MFPTGVFHGGRGKAVQYEVPQTELSGGRGTPDMFVSDHPQVGSSYAPAARRDSKPSTDGLNPNEMPSFIKTFYEQQRQQNVPDFSGNVMPLRIDDTDALVADYEGRLFSGFGDNGTLRDLTMRSIDGTPLIRLRKELDDDGLTVSRSYLPGEDPVGSLSPVSALGTDFTHYKGIHEVAKNYGFEPSRTRFNNIIDIGRHRHGEKPSERFIPSTVYAIRDGSKVRSEYAAFDPLLRKYSGLSLGASAAAVGSLLDQLPADEENQGALYAQ